MGFRALIRGLGFGVETHCIMYFFFSLKIMRYKLTSKSFRLKSDFQGYLQLDSIGRIITFFIILICYHQILCRQVLVIFFKFEEKSKIRRWDGLSVGVTVCPLFPASLFHESFSKYLPKYSQEAWSLASLLGSFFASFLQFLLENFFSHPLPLRDVGTGHLEAFREW